MALGLGSVLSVVLIPIGVGALVHSLSTREAVQPLGSSCGKRRQVRDPRQRFGGGVECDRRGGAPDAHHSGNGPHNSSALSSDYSNRQPKATRQPITLPTVSLPLPPP
jgi:hypothetical protein